MTAVPAVSDDLSREIARRRTFAIISHPDAGKTTLADLIAALLVPTAGRVEVDGITLDEGNRAAWQRRVYQPEWRALHGRSRLELSRERRF